MSGLVNSFTRRPVVVFVLRKETIHRERHNPQIRPPRAQRGQHPSAYRRAVGGSAIRRNRLQDRQTQAYFHLLQHPARSDCHPAAAGPRSPHTGLARPDVGDTGAMVRILAGHLYEGYHQAINLCQLPQLLEQVFLCAGENPAEKVRATHLAGVLQLQIPPNSARKGCRPRRFATTTWHCTSAYSRP